MNITTFGNKLHTDAMTLPRSPVKNCDKPRTIAAVNDKMDEMIISINDTVSKEFEKQSQIQQAALSTFRQELMEGLTEKIKELICQEVEKAIKPINEKLESAIKRIEELESKLKTNEGKSENLLRANNVTIAGVPSTPNENLRETIQSISSKLGFQQPLAHTARRFPSTNPSKSMINMKFYTQSDKLAFVNAYFRVAPNLKLMDVTGRISDTSRIYINHDLSKDQYEFHKMAMKMKREGKFSAVKIINAQVAVFKGNNKGLFIKSIQDLEN